MPPGDDIAIQILNGDRLHLDEHFALARNRIGEVLITRDTADLVNDCCLHLTHPL